MTLWLWLSVLAAAPSPGAVRWSTLDEAGRERALVEQQGQSLPERLERNASYFLGTPYRLSPLGEGSGLDPDPTFRLDAVDCLTFVEQTLALSLADGPAQVEAVLAQVRYRLSATYGERNHLMEAQWIPENVRKGFVRDVTDEYGGTATVTEHKVLTARSWTSRSSLALRLPPDRQPVGAFALRVIPLSKLASRASGIRSGTLLMVVREDLPLRATRITHLGFVLQKKGRTYLRHAARAAFGRVVDEELTAFLARNARYDKWKVVGVTLFEVTAPPHAKPQTVEAKDLP